MRKATLLFIILLAASVMAQTASTTTTFLLTFAGATFTAPDGTLGTFFVGRGTPPFCDLSCTTLGYSFCVNPVPGCREGFGVAPQGTFKGVLTSNYLKPDKLTFQYEAVTNIAETDSHFLNVICNAFDQYENCIDETVIPGDAGLIKLTFTKTPVSASLGSNTQKIIGNGTIETSTGADDLFSAVASGSVIGVAITHATSLKGTSVAFDATYSSTSHQAGPTASEMLKPQLSEAVRRRIEMLELRIMKP